MNWDEEYELEVIGRVGAAGRLGGSLNGGAMAGA